MTLTRRQSDEIKQIVQEEIKNSLLGRREAERLLEQALLNEDRGLNEAGLDTTRVDKDVIDDALGDEFADLANDAADDLVYDFGRRVLPKLAGAINQHGMSAVRVNPRTLAEELEDLNPDEYASLVEQCTSDVSEALKAYARKLGEMALNFASGDADELGSSSSSADYETSHRSGR